MRRVTAVNVQVSLSIAVLRRARLYFWVTALGLAGLGTARATSEPAVSPALTDSSTAEPSGPRLGGRISLAFLGRGRSLALEHRLKPAARLDALWPLSPRLEVGAAARGLLTLDPNYGVWAGTGALRYTLFSKPSVSVSALAGLGLGYNAPILHTDLDAGAPLMLYGSLALQALFRISEGLGLGVELEGEQLSVAHLGVAASYQLP